MHPNIKKLLVLLCVVITFVTLEMVDILANVDNDDTSIEAHAFHIVFLECAQQLDAECLLRILDHVSNPNTFDDQGGALFRVVNRREESDKMLAALEVLLTAEDIDPNGTGNHWPILKVALVNGHDRVVQRVLVHPKTNPRIHPNGVPCQVVAKLPIEVTLIEVADAPACVQEHYKARGVQVPQKSSSPKTPKKRGTADAQAPDKENPFRGVIPGELPPPDVYVMNPAAFDNIVDATRYYIFGKPWSGLALLFIVFVTFVQGGMGYLVWTSI